MKREKVLVAHGEEATLQAARQILRAAGYRRVQAVHSGRQAINQLAGASFDLLVAGKLKDIDAWKLVRMVRSGRFHTSTLPVVVLCESQEMPMTEPLAREHGAERLGLDALSQLPELAAGCIQGLRRPRLLVIEDDPRAAELAALSLGRHYEVDVAADGEAGVAAWERDRHQLVLLDVQLPGLSGPDVLRQIIAAEPAQAVVIITAYATRERHRDLMLAGASDFVEKPLSLAELRRTCDRVLRHRDYLAQSSGLGLEAAARHALSKHLWAAKRCLDSGQVSMAFQHVNKALVVSGDAVPTDDEWAQLLSEFEGR